MLIYLDTETIPSQDPPHWLEIVDKHAVSGVLPEIKAAANLKDPEKIAADIAARTERAKADLAATQAAALNKMQFDYRALALNGATAHIAAISFAIDDDTVQNVPCIIDGDDVRMEQDAIEYFFWWIETVEANTRPYVGGGRSEPFIFRATPPNIVAHHAQFDIRMIWQRAVVLGLTPPAWWPIDVRPSDQSRIQDTMTMWAGERERIKLDRLCRAFGLPGKGAIDGSKVYDAILGGRFDEVVNYCGDDVRRLRSCHRRLTGLQPLATDIAALTVDAGAAVEAA